MIDYSVIINDYLDLTDLFDCLSWSAGFHFTACSIFVNSTYPFGFWPVIVDPHL